jgi:hypothetical protein
MRHLSLKGYKLANGKVEKVASYKTNVSQRIAARKSKKVRVTRRAPG